MLCVVELGRPLDRDINGIPQDMWQLESCDMWQLESCQSCERGCRHQERQRWDDTSDLQFSGSCEKRILCSIRHLEQSVSLNYRPENHCIDRYLLHDSCMYPIDVNHSDQCHYEPQDRIESVVVLVE